MNKQVIVVSAVWCPSCLILKKHLKIIKEEYNLDFKYYDYDLDEDSIAKYNIGDILPVIIILEDDNEISRLTGEKSYEEIIEFLRKDNVV